MSFLNLHFERPDAEKALRGLFDDLCLPEPTIDDCLQTNDQGRAIFLTDYGCVLRIMPSDHVSPIDCPHFIEPIGEFWAGAYAEYNIRLNPGVATPLSDEETAVFYALLKQEYGISVHHRDQTRFNVGLIPGSRFPVMIDIDHEWVKMDMAMNTLRDAVRNIKLLWRDRPDPSKPFVHEGIEFEQTNPATQRMRELRTMLKDAFDAHHPYLRGTKMREFWGEMRRSKEKGQLVTPWPAAAHSVIEVAAQLYGEKLAQQCPG